MNVLVICIDTFRPDMVGKGKKLSHVKTPHLDTLASESVVFDRCFAEGGHSVFPCSRIPPRFSRRFDDHRT